GYINLAAFAGCAYALLRYRDTLIPLPSRWHAVALASLAAASVFLVAAMATAAPRSWLLAITLAWLAVWCACIAEPIARFWLVARLVGGAGAVLYDRKGAPATVRGVGGQQVAEIAGRLGSMERGVNQIEVGGAPKAVLAVPVAGLSTSGTLVVLAGPFTPGFG